MFFLKTLEYFHFQLTALGCDYIKLNISSIKRQRYTRKHNCNEPYICQHKKNSIEFKNANISDDAK